MLVLCPTYGRPANAGRLIESFRETAIGLDTHLHLVLDEMDKDEPAYRALPYGSRTTMEHWGTGTMVERTNRAAASVVALPYRPGEWPTAIGFCADDNVFVTEGWDLAVTDAFAEGAGIVNTNDLLVGNDKGGVWFVRTDIVAALRWFLFPDSRHLYVDYAATELGKAADALAYLPDVVIEHLHPYAGKADWDARYLSVNNVETDTADREAFYRWYEGPGFQADVEKVRACLARS